jgi:penicillin-binding protein 1A
MNIRQILHLKSKHKKPINKNLKYLYIGGGIIVFLGLLFFIKYVADGLPNLEELENPQSQLASNVFSIDGKLIGQFYKQNRVEVGIDEIPQHVINALIATEDKNFYNHWGVDLQRFIKAMIKNVLLFKREGASTITQQLAKNLYELKARHETKFGTVVRKMREWITAIQIEKTYTKREILEMYFNISWFGHSSYGISMAARTYFDKNVKELTVADAGVLVALLKSSVAYDPFEKYDNAFRRRNVVMQNMVDAGFLSEEEYDRLKVERINLSYKKIEEGIRGSVAPHFLEYIRQQMEKWAAKNGFDLYQDGLNIYTTLDSRMQKIAVDAVHLHIEDFQKQFDKRFDWNKYNSVLNDMIDRAIKNRPEYRKANNQEEMHAVYNRLISSTAFIDSVKRVGKRIEVGFVVMDPKNGEIRAMVGGRDQKFLYGLNHATQIKRQPGSAFKPIVYSVAIDNGLYPAYPIKNESFNYNGWSPQNFEGTTGGYVTLRHALAESLNLVAARLIIEGHAQLWKIGRFAEKMGIKSKLDLYPSIALGTSVISPLELTDAYATLANHGINNEPISILKIANKDDVPIESFTSYASEAIPEETAFIVTDMLRTAIDAGTGASARGRYNFHRPAAGKTGTTQGFTDAWFVGYTPQLCGGAWVGFDDQRIAFNGEYGQGARAALPIWAIFMHDVYERLNLPVEDFKAPASGNVIAVKFCRESIFESGEPRVFSPDCQGGSLTDIINIKDIPSGSSGYIRDTSYHFYDYYKTKDSSASKH